VLAAALVALGVAGAAPARAGHGAPVTAPSVPAEQIERLLGNGQPVVLIDLRPEARFRRGHLPGARSVPFAQLRRRYGEIPRHGGIF
jgi:3-mercaptopyruvate sulfurtransferase SseA